MNFDFDEYEKKCDEVRRANEELLSLFEKDMTDLSPKTIRRHLSNVSFYNNDFLLRQEPLTFEYGMENMKKFYKSMMDHGKISKEAYDGLF